MSIFTYFFIKFALTIQFIRSGSISSFDDGPVNKSTIELSKYRSKRYLLDSEDRIFGGHFVKDIRSYPFMLMLDSITWTSPDGDYDEGQCGGTLLSKTHVLTAAHCFKVCNCGILIDDDDCSNCTIYNKDDFTLYFGNIVPNNSKISRKIKTLHIHPKFKFEDRSHKCKGRFDIAVLELSTPVPISGRIYPIKLPEPVTLGKDELTSTMTSSFFDTNKKCTIVGWGLISTEDNRDNYMARKLKVASIPLIGHKRCINILFEYGYHPEYAKIRPTGGLCTDSSFCAKCPLYRNACYKGDSGGPIICGGVQVGVISWSHEKRLGPNFVNVFTRVDINVQWIRSKMSKKPARMQYEY